MGNNIIAFFFNGFHDLRVALTGSGVDASYPVSQLRNFLLFERIKFTSAVGEKSVTLDFTNVPEEERSLRWIGITEHNLSNLHNIRLLANPTASWGTPDVDIDGFVIPLDPDTEPLYWQETNLSRRVY